MTREVSALYQTNLRKTRLTLKATGFRQYGTTLVANVSLPREH